MQHVAEQLARVRAGSCKIEYLRATVRVDIERPDAVIVLAVDIADDVASNENVLLDDDEVSFVRRLVIPLHVIH